MSAAEAREYDGYNQEQEALVFTLTPENARLIREQITILRNLREERDALKETKNEAIERLEKIGLSKRGISLALRLLDLDEGEMYALMETATLVVEKYTGKQLRLV